MSWLFSRALAAEYSAATCLDGERSAPLSKTPTPQAFLLLDKTTTFSRLSRYGMTCELLTADRGEELLTWFLAGFPAKTFQLQERVRASTESDQAFGQKWHGLLAKYDPNTHSLKTAQCSLFEDLIESSVTLPRSVSMLKGIVYLRQTVARSTYENASGLLPTPVASDATTGAIIGKDDKFYMTKTGMPRKVNRNGKDGSVGLGRLVQLKSFPTPAARDYKGERKPETMAQTGRNPNTNSLPDAVEFQHGETGRLNPQWVEWLMGWPIGWTDLQPLEMAKFQEWQQQHGGC